MSSTSAKIAVFFFLLSVTSTLSKSLHLDHHVSSSSSPPASPRISFADDVAKGRVDDDFSPSSSFVGGPAVVPKHEEAPFGYRFTPRFPYWKELMTLLGSLPAPPRGRGGLIPPRQLVPRPNGTSLDLEVESWIQRVNHWCVYDEDNQPFFEKSTYCGFVVNGALVLVIDAISAVASSVCMASASVVGPWPCFVWTLLGHFFPGWSGKILGDAAVPIQPEWYYAVQRNLFYDK